MTIIPNFHDGNARPDLHRSFNGIILPDRFDVFAIEAIALMTTAESSLKDQSPDGKSRLPLSDLISGTVVFLVALPLCLGIALASGTQVPLFAGLIAGIVGGIVVGALSGSQTSVSGPAAGLTAVVAAQIAELGSFEAFLLAVVVGGVLQMGLGLLKAGSLSAFFPSSVIKGLLAAIGVILILKQIPHVLGHDSDPEGEMSYSQPDDETTFSELGTLLNGEIHAGAVVVGLLSIAVLVLWGRWKPLKNSIVPAPLVVVLLGVGLNLLFQKLGGRWLIGPSHLVEIPVGESARDVLSFLTFPDFQQWANPQIYFAGVTIAIVASLETLLNLQAVDKLDPQKRVSPPSRELLAQGCGNIASGMLGGLPVTSVIVRGSVNVGAGGKTKLSAIFHGILLAFCVILMPQYLNMIPLAALAAILLVTGFKLASPALFKQMSKEGRYQFIPFITTLVAIVRTDLLTGIIIGLCVSVVFILNSNLRRPVRRIVSTHVVGDVQHVELANQVTFLNRAAIARLLDETESGSHLSIDGTDTDYMDPDVVALIRDFKTTIAPARGVEVTLRGFRGKFDLQDDSGEAHATQELQARTSPDEILRLLQEGNRRFQQGHRLNRNLSQQVAATAVQQNPLAVVVSCIDSRVPAELVFDLGIGDIFSVRVAGNVLGPNAIGSVEYGVAVAGVKLVLVMGHTRCGAITSSVQLLSDGQRAEAQTGCSHLQSIVDEIEPSVTPADLKCLAQGDTTKAEKSLTEIAKRNVMRSVQLLTQESAAIQSAASKGNVLVVGALYDVSTGAIEFLSTSDDQRV